MGFEELGYRGLGGGQTFEDFAPMRTEGGVTAHAAGSCKLQVTAGGCSNKVIGTASGKLIKNNIIRHYKLYTDKE